MALADLTREAVHSNKSKKEGAALIPTVQLRHSNFFGSVAFSVSLRLKRLHQTAQTKEHNHDTDKEHQRPVGNALGNIRREGRGNCTAENKPGDDRPKLEPNRP